MPSTNLRMSKHDWARLANHFAPSFRRRGAQEVGAIGVLGTSLTERKHDLLLADVVWPQEGDIRQASSGALTFASSYVRRAHLRMRKDGLFGLVTFHTHPMADRSVNFSPFDDREDPELVRNLQELEPATRLLSVVVGKNSQRGRLWLSPDAAIDADQLVVIGDTVSRLSLQGEPAPVAPPPEVDRALAITGSGALAELASMRIAVVGASGTGSIVAELLARAGCTNMVAIDDDLLEDINLNRVLHSTRQDAADRVPKVMVLKSAIERLGLGCAVTAIEANVLDIDVARLLRSADLIFGCVDKALPRRLLSQFAFQHLIPYIDVGSEIGGDERGIVSVDARASYIAPGYPCLMCTGVVTPRQLHFESLSYEEQRREVELGYSDDLVIGQPAVMDLNMRSASYGMMFLRHLLQPFLLAPLPLAVSENVVTYSTRAIASAHALSAECAVCQRNPAFGYGDAGPQIGFDADVVASITHARS
jgi:hypothetical protein